MNTSKPILLENNIFKDERGLLSKIWQSNKPWVKQINISENVRKGTVRGIHGSKSQNEVKMITCISGRILDIAVNLKIEDADFGKIYYQELSKLKGSFIIPKGYGHAFQTLTDDCVLIYHHNILYEPSDQLNLSVFSPLFELDLPTKVTVISDKDKNALLVKDKRQLRGTLR